MMKVMKKMKRRRKKGMEINKTNQKMTKQTEVN